jgi:glycosyltransferase involved in cell wall biosynthesis
MRVALLTYNAQAGDAIGNQVAEKLAFFLERGANVRVFVESDQRLHSAVRPHCHRVIDPEPAGDTWRFLTSADLVVVEYGQYYPLLGLLPLLAGGRPRILFDYHGVTPPGLWGTHNREALEKGGQQRGLVWCADAALAHSRFTKRELLGTTQFPADRSQVLAHLVDTKRFAPGPPARHLRDELRLDRATLVLFVGRLAPNKRAPLLIEALDQLRDLTPQVHAVLVGDTGDLYQPEVARCRQRAAELGLAERVHFLGHVSAERLVDAYRSADVFVTASRHEGFCIPVLEAMACGVPVVAARAGALPETVANAGLTFIPDNARDLARQLRRVLALDKMTILRDPLTKDTDSTPIPTPCRPATLSPCQPLRVAIVSVRYGTEVVGGAETSLRTIATSLRETGHRVEVFTTCTRSESDWADDLPEGTTQVDGITVHRFRLDGHDRARHLETVRAILQADGPVSEEAERQYLAHSVHSTQLLEALLRNFDQFDAVLVGPYLFGLTHDVAHAFPAKTVLVPCFHDEPFARLGIWRPVYECVGSILYHSPEEQAWAEVEYGLNHPGAVCAGTVIDVETRGDAERGRALAKADRPYVVYCGRYSAEKNLPTLLDYARRYEVRHPGSFKFVFLGEGQVAIPAEPWARDLGCVDEASKRDLLAGAAALVQLSRYESLSLVALEAWAQRTPVIADEACAVLVGHLNRSGGGRAVNSFERFAQVLGDLRDNPEHWAAIGRRGQEYVQQYFGSRASFVARLEEALSGLTVPLAERMRRQGLARAAEQDRARWRCRFGRIVEKLLDGPPRPYRKQVEVRPRAPSRTVSAGLDSLLMPVSITNRGTHAVVDEGPGRALLRCEVVDESGRACAPRKDTPLPGILLPGQELAAAVRVGVPAVEGRYQARLSVWSCRGAGSVNRGEDNHQPCESAPPPVVFSLVVEEGALRQAAGCCRPLLDGVEAALAEAQGRQRLPDDYTDVTEGVLAKCKRWVKRKLLGNFKHAYVDVLSRQQSAFNRYTLAAVAELAECSAMLDHACSTRAADSEDEWATAVRELREAVSETRRRCAALEARLSRLETGGRKKEEAHS